MTSVIEIQILNTVFTVSPVGLSPRKPATKARPAMKASAQLADLAVNAKGISFGQVQRHA